MKQFGVWDNAELRAQAETHGMMPIIDSSVHELRAKGLEVPAGVPMSVFFSFRERVKGNHGGQDPGELRRRGGLSPGEMIAILRDERLTMEHVRDEAVALRRVLEWFKGWGWEQR